MKINRHLNPSGNTGMEEMTECAERSSAIPTHHPFCEAQQGPRTSPRVRTDSPALRDHHWSLALTGWAETVWRDRQPPVGRCERPERVNAVGAPIQSFKVLGPRKTPHPELSPRLQLVLQRGYPNSEYGVLLRSRRLVCLGHRTIGGVHPDVPRFFY